MNIEEYESQLTALLQSLPEKEREEAVAFYLELIADRIDEGVSEEEAVGSVPSPGEAAQAIIVEHAGKSDRHTSDGFFARLKRRDLKPLEWVALVVASPLWLTLLLCAFAIAVALAAVLFTLYLCVWVLIGCIWIVGAAFLLSMPLTLLFVIWGLQTGNAPYLLVNLGYSLIFFGGGAWVLKAALKVTRIFLTWQKGIAGRFSRHHEPEENRTGENPQTSEGENEATVEIATPKSTFLRKRFFRICWILVLVGLACVLAGFMASGFDWRIFTNMHISHGTMSLAGVQVADPSQLLFFPLFLLTVI